MKELLIKNILKNKQLFKEKLYKIRKEDNLFHFLEEENSKMIKYINIYDYIINKKNYLKRIEFHEGEDKMERKKRKSIIRH